MTGSAKFVVCGFWLVHNTAPAEDRTNSTRRKPHDSLRCNHFDYNHETASRNGANRHGDCCNSVQLQCQHANSYAVREALNFWGLAVPYVWIDVDLYREKFSISFENVWYASNGFVAQNKYFFFKIDVVFFF